MPDFGKMLEQLQGAAPVQQNASAQQATKIASTKNEQAAYNAEPKTPQIDNSPLVPKPAKADSFQEKYSNVFDSLKKPEIGTIPVVSSANDGKPATIERKPAEDVFKINDDRAMKADIQRIQEKFFYEDHKDDIDAVRESLRKQKEIESQASTHIPSPYVPSVTVGMSEIPLSEAVDMYRQKKFVEGVGIDKLIDQAEKRIKSAEERQDRVKEERDAYQAEMRRRMSAGDMSAVFQRPVHEQEAIKKTDDLSTLSDATYYNLKDALNLLKSVRRVREGSNFAKEFGKGFADTVSDLRFYDFGTNELSNSEAFKRVVRKSQSGKELTDDERNLLDSAATLELVKNTLSREVSMWYNVGGGTAHTLKFGAEMAMSPAGRLASKGIEAATNIGSKVAVQSAKSLIEGSISSGIKSIVKNAPKYLAKGIANSGENGLRTAAAKMIMEGGANAVILPLSIQLQNTLSDANMREVGNAQYHQNEDGSVMYTGIQGGKTAGRAFLESFANNAIESFSESSGYGFEAVGSKMLGKVFAKSVGDPVKATGIGRLFGYLSTKPGIKEVAKLKHAMNLQGVGGEFMEEQVGTLLRASIGVDATFSDFVDFDQQTETLVSVIVPQLLFGAAGYAGNARYRYKAGKALRGAISDYAEVNGLDNKEAKEYATRIAQMDAGTANSHFRQAARLMYDSKMAKSEAEEQLSRYTQMPPEEQSKYEDEIEALQAKILESENSINKANSELAVHQGIHLTRVAEGIEQEHSEEHENLVKQYKEEELSAMKSQFGAVLNGDNGGFMFVRLNLGNGQTASIPIKGGASVVVGEDGTQSLVSTRSDGLIFVHRPNGKVLAMSADEIVGIGSVSSIDSVAADELKSLIDTRASENALKRADEEFIRRDQQIQRVKEEAEAEVDQSVTEEEQMEFGDQTEESDPAVQSIKGLDPIRSENLVLGQDVLVRRMDGSEFVGSVLQIHGASGAPILVDNGSGIPESVDPTSLYNVPESYGEDQSTVEEVQELEANPEQETTVEDPSDKSTEPEITTEYPVTNSPKAIYDSYVSEVGEEFAMGLAASEKSDAEAEYQSAKKRIDRLKGGKYDKKERTSPALAVAKAKEDLQAASDRLAIAKSVVTYIEEQAKSDARQLRSDLDKEYSELADSGKDALLIADAYRDLSTQKEEDLAPLWQKELMRMRFNAESFYRFQDRGVSKDDKYALHWFTSENANSSNSVDTVASELSYYGVEVSPEMIVEFIASHPKKTWDNEIQSLMDRLNGRFMDLMKAKTGKRFGIETQTGRAYIAGIRAGINQTEQRMLVAPFDFIDIPDGIISAVGFSNVNLDTFDTLQEAKDHLLPILSDLVEIGYLGVQASDINLIEKYFYYGISTEGSYREFVRRVEEKIRERDEYLAEKAAQSAEQGGVERTSTGEVHRVVREGADRGRSERGGVDGAKEVDAGSIHRSDTGTDEHALPKDLREEFGRESEDLRGELGEIREEWGGTFDDPLNERLNDQISTDLPFKAESGKADVASDSKRASGLELAEKINRSLGRDVAVVQNAQDFQKQLDSILSPNDRFRLEDGTIYGYALGGKIYINSDTIDPDTVVHEYTHLWSRVVRERNRSLWDRGIDLLKETDEWQRVVSDPNYANLSSDDAIADEVLARLSGRTADEMASGLGGEKSLISKIKDWLNEFFSELKETFSKWTGKDLSDLSLDEFVNMPIRDLSEGVNIFSEREIRAIEERAKADGSWMKAPNGKPTNLTERQWAQVRTKDFKDWFGDWEKAARIEKLRNSKPIEITGNEIEPSDDLKQYKKNALEYGKGLRGKYVCADTGESVNLGKEGIKEVLQHDYKNIEQLQSVAAIPQLIENSIYVDTADNTDRERHPQVKEYRYYVSGLKIGGVDYSVRLAIAVDHNGNRFYDHKLTQIEKGQLIDAVLGITNPVLHQEATLPLVKDTKLVSLLQTNVSKAVDENGEPKVADVSEYLNDDIRTKIGKDRRESYRNRLEKSRPDLVERGLIDDTIDLIESFGEDNPKNPNKAHSGNTKLEELALYWTLNSNIRLPEESYKILAAAKAAEQHKVDPLSFDNPTELIEKYVVREKVQRINPDDVPQFSDKYEDEDTGVSTYQVEDSNAGQEAVRAVIDTHFGKDANPWCIAARQDGSLDEAWEYWHNTYNAFPKRIAFKDGKLLAFSASDTPVETFWFNRENYGDKYIESETTLPNGEKQVVYYDSYGSIAEPFGARFKIGKRKKEEFRARVTKNRPDIVERGEVDITIEELEKFGEENKAPGKDGNAALEDAAVYWITRPESKLRLPEDAYAIYQAFDVANRKKFDPKQYENPKAIIDEYASDVREPALDPDTVKEFVDRQEAGESGIVTYRVKGSRNGQAAVRKAIDTHFGQDANPWCLAARIGGGLEQAWGYWKHYNAYPKRIAFKDGKLVGFSANDSQDVVWWDRQDKAREGIVATVNRPDGLRVEAILDTDSGDPIGYISSSQGNRKNGVYKEWYAKGDDLTAVLKLVEIRKDGKKDGVWEGYYDNGQLSFRVEFKDGRNHGAYDMYHRDGKIDAHIEYKDGNKHGVLEQYDDDGLLLYREKYKDGKPEGSWEKYYANGELKERIEYKDGKRIGVWEMYHENGQLQKREEYKDGKRIGVWEMYHENGQLQVRYEFKDGKQHGVEECYFADGILESRGEYKDGKRIGVWEHYHRDGKIDAHIEYKDGKKHGVEEKYGWGGQLESRKEYKDGEFVRDLPLDDNLYRKTDADSPNVDQRKDVAEREAQVDTNPTEKQIKAGNYKKGHINETKRIKPFSEYKGVSHFEETVGEWLARVSPNVAKKQVARDLGERLGIEIDIVENASGLRGNQANARGWYNTKTGRISIVLDNNSDAADVVATVLHEAVGHRGLRSLLGEKSHSKLMDDIWDSLGKEEQSRLSNEYGDNHRLAAEEYAAKLAEGGIPDLSIIRRVAAKVRAFLRDVLGVKVDVKDGDIVYFLWKAQSQMERGRMMSTDRLALVSEDNRVSQYTHDLDDFLYRKSDEEIESYCEENSILCKEALDVRSNGLWSRMRESAQDAHVSILQLQNEIAKQNGKPIPDYQDFHSAVSLKSSRAAHKIDSFEKKEMGDLYSIVRKMRKQVKDAMPELERNNKFWFDDYLKAKHVPERNAFMRRKNKNTEDYAGEIKLRERIQSEYGMSLDGFVSSVESASVYKGVNLSESMWEKLRVATAFSVETWYESGMISKIERDKILGVRSVDGSYIKQPIYEHYVPLRGFAEDLSGEIYTYYKKNEDRSKHPANPMKRAGGRDTESESPLGYIREMAHMAIVGGESNIAKQYLFNLVINNKTDKLAVRRTMQIKVKDTLGNEHWEDVYPNLPQARDEGFAFDSLKQYDEYIAGIPDADKRFVTHQNKAEAGLFATDRQRKQHEVHVMIGGSNYVIYCNGIPKIAQAVNGDNQVASNDFFRALAATTHFMSAAVTSRSPDFIASNAIRDFQWATARISIAEGAKYLGSFYKNYGKALRLLMPDGVALLNVTGGIAMSKKTRENLEAMYDEFKANGGATGYITSENQERHLRKVRKQIKHGGGYNAVRFADTIWNFFSRPNEAAENLTRFAVYLTSRQQGRTPMRAASDAKEVTVNFNRRGSGRNGFLYMQTCIPFFNAGMQGANNALSLVWHKNTRVKSAIAISLAAASGFFLSNGLLMGLMSGGDDDKLKKMQEVYDSINEHTRKNNFCIVTPDLNLIKIPLSIEVRASYGIGDAMRMLSSGNIKPVDFIFESIDGAMEVFPVNPVSGNGGISNTRKLLQEGKATEAYWQLANTTIIPGVVRPLVDVATNLDFAGRSIAPIGKYTDNRNPGFDVGRKGTGRGWSLASKGINTAFGGDDFSSGNPNMYPDHLKHIVYAYGGGTVKLFGQVADMIDASLQGEEIESRNIPILNRLYQSNAERSIMYNHIGEYDKARADIDAQRNRYDNMVKRRDSGEWTLNQNIDEIEKSGLVKLSDELNDATKSLKDIYEEIDLARSKKNQSGVDDLEKKADAIRVSIIDQYNQYKNN